MVRDLNFYWVEVGLKSCYVSNVKLGYKPMIIANIVYDMPKVNGPNPIADLEWTPIFKWCVLRCGSKNGCQKNVCFKKIGLRVPNLLAILGSIGN